ncbi:MAG: hypothetical protein U1E37_12405 [Sphingomonadaceae bacterium]|mgnify:FL=1
MALRANRVYPAAIAASLLIAASCQWFQLLGLVHPGGAADLLVGTAHLLALASYLGGWASQWAGSVRRAAWRDELQAR